MNERVLFSSKHEFENSIFNSKGAWVLIILAAIVSWGAIIVAVLIVLYAYFHIKDRQESYINVYEDRIEGRYYSSFSFFKTTDKKVVLYYNDIKGIYHTANTPGNFVQLHTSTDKFTFRTPHEGEKAASIIARQKDIVYLREHSK